MKNDRVLRAGVIGRPSEIRFRMGKTSLRLALLCSALALVGCNTVEFYELERFTDRVMAFDEGSAEPHFHQKVHYSMEGSAGGIGTSAGGGCGCS